ncbi:Glycosyl transferase family 2 [[Clostridium] aminophilum]|uniref:Glycosyl transferase family 2 n=1 Tax=[Clostridium] aminophilum TaxID=1526 RepID=A0A1I0CAN3_9FIRM|nr:glycosyltransferase family 2 protein [[Clostridium] aminophilum]SET16333.1 Glycosyl transferase family 2 [[Clostridium] aminophilum]
MSLISVIVPLYKGKRFVERILTMADRNAALLRDRNTPYEMELILVNDDPTETIEKKRFDRVAYPVFLINNERNMGIHASRVRGIDFAHGEYIWLLDQDDRIEDEFLWSQMRILSEKDDAPFVVCNGYIQHKTYTRRIYPSCMMQKLTEFPKAYAYMDNRIVSPGQCIIRKKYIRRFWLSKALRNNGADDLFLWMMILSTGHKPTTNPGLLYTHVNTDRNTSLNLDEMYSSVAEMIDIARLHPEETGIAPELLDIMEYRNNYLWRKKSRNKVGWMTRLVIHGIYAVRQRKYTGMRR